MLVLHRKRNQKITLSDGVEITVLSVCGQVVRLGFLAPPEIAIVRDDAVKKGSGFRVREDPDAQVLNPEP